MHQAFPENAGSPPGPSGPQDSIVLRLFVGPNGVRTGWRLLMFFVAAAALTFLLHTVISSIVRFREAVGFTAAVAIFAEGGSSLALLLSTALMARVERRSLKVYGIAGGKALGRQFGEGLIYGFLAITALLTIIAAAHGFSFGNLALRGPNLIYYGCGWAAGFLMVALTEEFLFRGYALFTLSAGIGFWPAALLLSAGFAAIHLNNPGETWLGVVSAGLIGLFFCFTIRRTGTVWFAVGMHFAWDYCESFIYGVPDSGVIVRGHLLDSSLYGSRWVSGGRAGPEGSVVAFVMMAALFVLFGRLHQVARFPTVAVPNVDGDS